MSNANEVWLVLDESGDVQHAATYPEACHEHINEAIEAGLLEAAKWKVRRAVYDDAAPAPSDAEDALSKITLPSEGWCDERIKTLMQQCGWPNSTSVYQAFKQFQNEYEHAVATSINAARGVK